MHMGKQLPPPADDSIDQINHHDGEGGKMEHGESSNQEQRLH